MRVVDGVADDVRLWLVGGALLVSLVAVNGWAYQPRVPFSPDSWSYYELSQTFGGDLLRISTQRQYSWVSEYNVSFPPLWPAAIAATDAASGLGPASDILLNYAITGLIWVLLAFVLAAVVPSGVVAHPALAAAALMGCVVFAPGYMAEVVDRGVVARAAALGDGPGLEWEPQPMVDEMSVVQLLCLLTNSSRVGVQTMT